MTSAEPEINEKAPLAAPQRGQHFGLLIAKMLLRDSVSKPAYLALKTRHSKVLQEK
jgi:hypothetical protein